MKEKAFERILQDFKDREQPESVLMIAGNMSLIRIILCWSRLAVERDKPSKLCKARSEEDKWGWLWANVSYRREDLLASIPGATSRTARDLAALIASRILYPDGTINSFVQRYLQQRTLQVFGAKRISRGSVRAGTR